MLISLIVPCYNEEEAMPLFYKEASRVAAEMKTSHGADFEFIFVDDGSRDGTLRVARELHAQDDRVRYVSFSRNFGKEAGIYAGLKAAKGDYIATMDADLQDPPTLLPQMLDTLLTGDYDCAATRRTTRKGEPLLRSWFALALMSARCSAVVAPAYCFLRSSTLMPNSGYFFARSRSYCEKFTLLPLAAF